MMRQDFHVHTHFCHGENSPEEMVQAAIQAGMEAIGMVAHSYTDFEQSYCMRPEDVDIYRAEITALKEKYQRKIRILCGIEQDYYSSEPTDGYDYVIGSVHYVKAGDAYLSVDEKEEKFLSAVENYFGGDIYAFAECYYDTVARLGELSPDIIGHFDLVTKFNEGDRLFDTAHPRYKAAWQKAADVLLPLHIPFEINVGAISRGYRTTPYPSADILSYIKDRGGSVILSSDSHQKDTLCYQFDRWEAWAKELGLTIETR